MLWYECMKFYIVIEPKMRTQFDNVIDANTLMLKILNKGGDARIEVM